MTKKLIVILTLVLTFFGRPVFAEELKQELSLNLKVNIRKPVCRLASGDQTVYFDEFDALDIITGNDKTTKNTILNFTDCNSVDKINITFNRSGQSPSIDTVNNWIPNKSGQNMAAGIAVMLLDDKKNIIDLGKKMAINIGHTETSKQVMLKAKIVPTDKIGYGITSGKLETAVGIEISYE